MNSIKTILAFLVLTAPAFAGGRHVVHNVGNLAIVQPDYYYSITPQVRAPFVYRGDVDSLIQARQELLRLSTGLNTVDIQAQKQLLSLPILAPLQIPAQVQVPQRVESAGGCAPGKCNCERCPPNCKNCPKVPEPVVPADPEVAPESRPASDLDAKAIDVLTRYNCIKCHGKVKPDGDFPIATGGGVIDLGRGDRFEIHGKAAHNEMPPPGKGEPLTPEDLDILYRWANSKGR